MPNATHCTLIAVRSLPVVALAILMLALPGAGATSEPDSQEPSSYLMQADAAPLAAARGARTAVIGEAVQLDGTASTDSQGRRIRYAWTLRTPPGSGARLSNASAARPTFTIDLVGDYFAELVVSDGRRQSAPSTVRISTGNVAPLADAGRARTVPIGHSVVLDATASHDANDDVLAYHWRIVDAPVGSHARLENARAARPVFVPDVEGRYRLAVVVSDGRLSSAPAQVEINTSNSAPVADAGRDVTVAAGRALVLNGGASYDPDDAALAYRWSLLHAPAGSMAALSGDASATPVLNTDQPGLYVVQLHVGDGNLTSAPDTVVIEAAHVIPQLAAGGGADTDGDGVPDTIDNCAEHFNPSQLDTNGDGFGNRCDADLDNDGFVTNTIDLGILRVAFFSSPGDANWNPDADFNGDNQINVLDLGILRQFFFQAPGPIAITFINPAGGTWHDPNNWSPAVVPDARYTVRIDLDPGMVVEYSTGDTLVKGLRATSPVLISGGELTVSGNALFEDTLTMQSGATLAGANILPPATVPAPRIDIPLSQNVTLDGVSLGMDLDIAPAASVTVANGIELVNATITLASNNNFTSLNFSGANGATSTLGGTGEVVFGGTATVDNRNRILVVSSGHNLVIAPGITIRSSTSGGRVAHNVSNGSITFQGNVVSDVTNRTVTLQAAPLIIEGALDVSNDAVLLLNFLGVGGEIAAAGTATVNTGELALTGDFTINGTLTITDATLDLGNVVGDDWNNAGTITLSNATLELGGTFMLADVGNITGTGTTIINGTFDNIGQSVDLAGALPGAVEFGTGATVLGGTLTGAAVTVPVSQSVTFDGVTLGADLTIDFAATLTIVNGITLNSATITLASNNNFTSLNFSGANGATSTLGGTGEVVFGGTATVDNRNRILVVSSGHNLVIAPGITIRSSTSGGQVVHNVSNGSITFQGNVVSDVTNRTVTLQAAPLIIEGALDVSNDAVLLLNFLGVGGEIAAAGTATVNTGELALTGDFTINGTLTITDATLDLGNVVGDDWNNAGTITLSNATLELGGTFMLADVGNITGTGTTIINGTFDNIGQSVDLAGALPGAVEFGTGATVLGGTLTGAAVTVPVSQSVTFDGVTLGADLTIDFAATLTIVNGITLNSATITLASNNNFTSLNFSGANGATSTLGGTGEVVFGGTATVDNRNRILVVSSGHNLVIAPGITIRSSTSGGQVVHNVSNGSITFQGNVVSDVTNRTVTLQAAPLIIEGALDVSNDAVLLLNFLGVGGEIAAAGTATVNTGELALTGDFTINGTLTITDATLDLGNVVGDDWNNAGTITLSNATLELGGTFMLADVGNITGTGTTIINGTFDNIGQSVDLAGALPGAVEFGTGATVLGGTLTGAAVTVPVSQSVTFDGVTLGADLTIDFAATLTIVNGITLNSATITLASNNNFTSLNFSGANGATSTLGGTGEVVFGGTATVDNRNRILVISSGHDLVIAPGITIRSSTSGGQVVHNVSNGSITFQGNVVSDVTNRTVTLQAAPLIIEGALDVSNDAVLLLNFLGVGGEIAAAGTATVNTGELALTGDFTINGTLTITDATLDLGNVVGDDWNNAGTITLSNATLELGGTFMLADVGNITGTGTTIINGTFDNIGQSVDLAGALPGAVEFGTGATVLGGTLTGAAVTVPVSQSVTFDGVTLGADLTIDFAATLTIVNGITLNSATITLASNNNFTSLNFSGANGATSTLGGTGEVVFGGTATVDNRNRILVISSGHDLVIAPGITIRSSTSGGQVVHNISNGSITLQGNVVSDLSNRTVTLLATNLSIEGSLQAGAGAVISLGNYTLTGSATVQIDIGGTTTAQFGRLLSSNTGNLAGTLDLVLVNAFAPTLGDTFPLMTFGTRNGTFATENGTNLGGGLFFTVNYNPGDVTLEVTN